MHVPALSSLVSGHFVCYAMSNLYKTNSSYSGVLKAWAYMYLCELLWLYTYNNKEISDIFNCFYFKFYGLHS